MLAQVWVAWCKKKSICKTCNELILSGLPMVYVRIRDTNRPYPYTMRKHLHCWLADAIDWLEKNPYTRVNSPGRKRLQLSDEDRKIRLKLLRRRALLVFRQRVLAYNNPKLAADKIGKMQEKVDIIVKDICKVGGVPKSWK